MSQAIVLVVLGSTIWLGFDASQRDWTGSSFARSTIAWVLGSLALWIVVFPAYLVARGRTPLKQRAA